MLGRASNAAALMIARAESGLSPMPTDPSHPAEVGKTLGHLVLRGASRPAIY
jgi:hypothetical protein